MTTIDMTRTRITHPDGIESPVRFVYIDGVAAAWVEQRRPTRQANRVLFATGTFTSSASARMPHIFTTEDGQEWAITQLSGGGCSCNRRNSPLVGIPVEQLVDPDFSSV